MSDAQTNMQNIYPIIIDDGAQSVRNGENSAVCKFSVGNGNTINSS
jgi:hypothetical protein